MITLIVLIVVYLLSVLKMYFFMRTAHRPGGRWYGQHTGFMELFWVFIPLFNTIFSIMVLFSSGKEEDYFSRTPVDRFFGIDD